MGWFSRCSQCGTTGDKKNLILKKRLKVGNEWRHICMRCKRGLGIGKRWGG